MAMKTPKVQEPKKRKAERTPGYYVSLVFRYLLLILIAMISIAPFFLAAMGTFKTNAEIIAYPPKILPENWLYENWVKVWNTDIGSGGTFPRWLFNTAFLSVTVASLQVICCSMAAYAFARLDFPGKNATFNFMLATMMIPGAVTLIPAYVLMSKLHLINTYWALIIPNAVGASGIFMLTQFFKSIPVDLEEAAVIDGASHLKIFSKVVLPLARPSLLTVFILQFQGMWNAFLQPLLYENSPDMYVLNVALSIFKQQYKAQWNLTLVGAMFNAIPVLVLFFIFSRYYIEGVSYTGMKG